MTICEVNNKVDEVTGMLAAKGDIVKYSEVGRISEDYQRMQDANTFMQRAFDTKGMKNFLSKNKDYNGILVNLTNKSHASDNHKYIEKMQTALISCIAEKAGEAGNRNVLTTNGKTTYMGWRSEMELSPLEVQFIEDLYYALNDFTAAWSDPSMHNQNSNLGIVMQSAMNYAVIHQPLGSERDPNERSRLGQFIALASQAQGKNNILGLLGILDGDKNEKHEVVLYDSNGEKHNFMLQDLYSENDATMQQAMSLLFDVNTNKPATGIIHNPGVYRSSIKTMMKATEVDQFTRGLNMILKLSAIGKLSSYSLGAVFGRLSGMMMGLTCFFTGYLNMMSYKRKNSKKRLHHALKMFGLSGDYFDFTDAPLDWIQKRLNYLETFITQKDPRKGNVNDPTRKQGKLINFSRNKLGKLSWMLMGVANIFGDTIFKGEYQLIAMDLALQKLGWDAGELESHLYRQVTYKDENGNYQYRLEINEYAVYTLLSEYIKKLSDVTGFPQVEGGGQSPLKFNITGTKGLKRGALIGANALLNMWHWMTQWGTTYVNNTYRILAGGSVNMVYDFIDTFKTGKTDTGDWKRKQYNGPGGRWLITKYTRQVDTDGVAMPREAAQELVSKEEYAMEVCRLLAGIRNMYRLGNMGCRDENGKLDIRCTIKHFADVAFLPAQAAQLSHPIIRGIIDTIHDAYENFNYFGDRENLGVNNWDIIEDSLINNVLKPMFRGLYPIKEIALAFEKGRDDMNDDDFLERLFDVVMSSTDAMLYYTANELESYTYSSGAYGEKSYLNNDLTIFRSPNYMRDVMGRISEIKSVERVSRDGFWDRISDIFPTIRLFSNIIKGEDSTDFYASDHAEKFLLDLNGDEDIRIMLDGKFTKDMLDNYDYMQYVRENLTADWQSYGAEFENGVRKNQYNTTEIQYFEALLQKDMAEARRRNPQASDLQIYDSALKAFFGNDPTYLEMKKAIQAYADAGETEMGVYTDYLASATWLQETTGVKGLALIAEYRKRQLMEKAGLQYSSSATKEQKAMLKLIENQVAGELGPYLWLADRRQYNNLVGRWFVEKHPEYKDYDPFKGLTKDGEWNIHGDVKTTGTLGTVMFVNTLARTELANGNVNGYALANVFTEKFGSPWTKNEKGEFVFDKTKAAQQIDLITLFDQAMEDGGYTPLERSMAIAPAVVRDLELFTWALTDDSKEAKDFREQVGEPIIDNLRGLLHDTYSNFNSLPELLDILNNENVINKILGKGNKNYKGGSSLYHGKNTKKQYDYYSKPINVFKAWGSSNLSKFINSYGKGKSRYAGSYSPKEFYFLNQRCYRNPVNSTRIAPDIPLNIGGFSKTTVKSKNPVSGFTTNIKPWKERPTAKLGKGKSIVGGSGTRGPVSSFKA